MNTRAGKIFFKVSLTLCPSHITARDALRCFGDVKMSNIAEHR